MFPSWAWHREVQPFDEWHSISISSKVDPSSLLALTRSWKHTIQKSFPAVLKDQYFVAYLSADGTWAAPTIKFRADYQDEFTAACEAETTRTFLAAPPSSTESETPFNARSHQIDGSFADGDDWVNERGVIRSCLHGTISERWATFKVGAGWQGISGSRPLPLMLSHCFITPFAEGNIAATSPATLTPGEEFIHKVHVEEWRLDIWVKYLTKAKIPAQT